ncbi:unknown [Clostridium sp. CAG:1000]|nr:unknown [Clostridium sp. CAG:1000]
MKTSEEELKLFDMYLDSLYIKRKIDRNRIIGLYKRLFKKKKNLNDFETDLEKLGWDEITIRNITNYVSIWNFRKDENEKIWKNKNK